MLYLEKLKQAINGWKEVPIDDEWFFEKFRDDTIAHMSSSEAFLAIVETIDLLLIEEDESTACEILQTIINLARKSGTTECPTEIFDNKKKLESLFLNWGDYSHSKLRELFSYYRL